MASGLGSDSGGSRGLRRPEGTTAPGPGGGRTLPRPAAAGRLTQEEIAAKIGCSQRTVRRLFLKFLCAKRLCFRC
ncbi:MAG: hypothetical protein FJ276_20425 [Planctomycetes bacterium]|nr:hypothetical protein [Planctomycetota bacterium]